MSDISRVAVLGAGTMGHGIAYVAAAAGCQVRLNDKDPTILARGIEQAVAAFDRAVARGKMDGAAREAGASRIIASSDAVAAVADADLVIEAIPERLDLKQRLFASIEPHAPDGCLLASNTSALSITALGAELRDPSRFLGMHFFNPVPAMKLVELVRGERTSDATVDRARAFVAALGRVAITVRDTPGFATSRLGVVLGLEAIRMLEQGVASAPDIDRAMELGYNHPMGPLRLTDLVGLDVRLAIAEHLHSTFGDDTYRPPALLRAMVRDGKLGKKSGEGFYRWEDAG